MELWINRERRENNFIKHHICELARKYGDKIKFSMTDKLRLSYLEEFSHLNFYPRGVPLKKKYTLRPDQEKVLKWMRMRESSREYGIKGGILAAKPGLGKTLDLFCLILSQPKNISTLIVVPKTLINNIVDQAKKFFGDRIKYLVLHSEWDSKKIPINRKTISSMDFVLTTYDTLVSNSKKYIEDIFTKVGKNIVEYRLPSKRKRDNPAVEGYDILYNTPWDRIVCDESQDHITNIKTLKFKAFMALYGDNRWCLSGTCIKNSSKEGWSQLHAIGYTDITSEREWKRKGKDFFENQKLSRFFHFTNYEDTNISMPELDIERLVLSFDKKTMRVYNDLFSETSNIVKRYINGDAKYLETIKMITKLRQICSIPSISSKRDLEGLIGPEMSSGCPKIKKIIDIVNSSNDKVIIFSNFVEGLKVVQSALMENDIFSDLLCSSTRNRSHLIRDFEKNDKKVLLSSFKIGGIGLNLQFIKTVIFLDPSWNESTHLQALQRCWRVGQDKEVKIYQLVMQDSIEEKIYEICSRKREISEDIENGVINENEVGILKIEVIKSLISN